jgi:hypothetical protein
LIQAISLKKRWLLKRDSGKSHENAAVHDQGSQGEHEAKYDIALFATLGFGYLCIGLILLAHDIPQYSSFADRALG